MDFCKECGSILKPVKVNSGKQAMYMRACPKCGNNTANVWQVQTRGSDESSTQFLKCLRCGFTHREYT